MNTELEGQVDKKYLNKIAELCQVMGNHNRMQILFLCLDKPVPVGVIAETLGLSQSLVSHNLRHMREVRLLRAERHGKEIHYAVDDDHVRCILQDLLEHVKH